MRVGKGEVGEMEVFNATDPYDIREIERLEIYNYNSERLVEWEFSRDTGTFFLQSKEMACECADCECACTM